MDNIEFTHNGKDYEIAPMQAIHCEEGAIILEKIYKKWTSFAECKEVSKDNYKPADDEYFITYKPIDYFFFDWNGLFDEIEAIDFAIVYINKYYKIPKELKYTFDFKAQHITIEFNGESKQFDNQSQALKYALKLTGLKLTRHDWKCYKQGLLLEPDILENKVDNIKVIFNIITEETDNEK